MQNTSKEYDTVVQVCQDLFVKKMKDYGCAWRILRLPSLTDQIFIKAQNYDPVYSTTILYLRIEKNTFQRTL